MSFRVLSTPAVGGQRSSTDSGIGIPSTAKYQVDLVALHAYHARRQFDRTLDPVQRRFHASQERLLRVKTAQERRDHVRVAGTWEKLVQRQRKALLELQIEVKWPIWYLT